MLRFLPELVAWPTPHLLGPQSAVNESKPPATAGEAARFVLSIPADPVLVSVSAPAVDGLGSALAILATPLRGPSFALEVCRSGLSIRV